MDAKAYQAALEARQALRRRMSGQLTDVEAALRRVEGCWTDLRGSASDLAIGEDPLAQIEDQVAEADRLIAEAHANQKTIESLGRAHDAAVIRADEALRRKRMMVLLMAGAGVIAILVLYLALS